MKTTRFIPVLQKLALMIKSGLFVAVLLAMTVHSSDAGGGAFTIPPLDKIIPLAIEKNLDSSRSADENKLRVTKLYYQIQFKTNQLGIAEEVKKRFGTAIEKAEEKYEEDEGDISQSDITKLKLGRSSSDHDVIALEHEVHALKLDLADLTGLDLSKESTLEEKTILPVDFPKQSFKEVFGKTHRVSQLEQKKAFIKVDEARSQLELAKGSRKITRALLVTELANYDFGIGDSGDLFQALIIYTRVLSGYYETVYNFNMAVAELNREVTN
ncbi:hypothetical protein MNBD_NITROSPINAE05-867 [hydrothermal vent metagenome]|uniref:TolC family protein n=1 Tax=hydrothermal vent metagenome TaxID=652676 RepID=A0A3B1D528_9ZZZZ